MHLSIWLYLNLKHVLLGLNFNNKQQPSTLPKHSTGLSIWHPQCHIPGHNLCSSLLTSSNFFYAPIKPPIDSIRIYQRRSFQTIQRNRKLRVVITAAPRSIHLRFIFIIDKLQSINRYESVEEIWFPFFIFCRYFASSIIRRWFLARLMEHNGLVLSASLIWDDEEVFCQL